MTCITEISVFPDLEKGVERIIGLSYHESTLKIRCRVDGRVAEAVVRMVEEGCLKSGNCSLRYG